MRSRTSAFIVILAAAVVAAGGGAYIAVRQNAVESRPHLASPASSPSGGETEALPAPGAATVGKMAGATMPAPVAAQEVTRTPVEPEPMPTVGPTVSRRAAARPPESLRRPPSRSGTAGAATPLPEAPKGPAPDAAVSPMVPVLAPVVDPDPPEAAIVPPDIHPPPREYVELVVPADAVVGLQIETTVHSGRARVEDRVDARVSRDVRVDGRVAIPEGAEVSGVVTLVERGGRMKNAARIGIQFDTVRLPDGTRTSLVTETIVREGESPAGRSTARIGGAAIGGAILGAIFGGGKGAAIGGSVGAAGGAAAAMSGEPNEVVLPAGSIVSARLLRPVAVVVEK